MIECIHGHERRIAPVHRTASLTNGFTLIEVLVVVGIIGLLAGILVPTLSTARQQARGTVCLANLKTVAYAQLAYLNDQKKFPPLNNEPKDGNWQYSYLIYDGKDWHNCFGPLIRHASLRQEIDVLYCPLQVSPYHRFATPLNPWPVRPNNDTRASYARRPKLSGRQSTDFKRNIGIFADVLHLPEVVQSGHKKGVNAAYLDGHALWVWDTGKFTDNDLGSPFDPIGNEVIEDLWEAIDKKG